ncbi:MAG: hypothetical protein NVS9B14_12440 [Candidatus Acidiferrum sp.]
MIILFIKMIPFAMLLYHGVISILEAVFPSLRDPDFNSREVDDDSGSPIQILGWKKVLTPPRVLARGYMSDSAACAVALGVGFLCIFIATFGIHHVTGVPESVPDFFGKF